MNFVLSVLRAYVASRDSLCSTSSLLVGSGVEHTGPLFASIVVHI